MVIPNVYYSINLNLRYFLDIPCISVRSPIDNNRHDGKIYCPHCHVSNKSPANAIDKTGHHLINGCKRDTANGPSSNKSYAQSHATHDSLRHVLYNCCQHALAYASREEPPKTVNGPRNKRVDIETSISVNNVLKKFSIDVTIVSPFEGTQSGVLENPTDAGLLQPDKRAENAKAYKKNKYEALCTDSDFVPFVVNTTGKVHHDADLFLDKLADHAAARRHIPPSIIKNYYLKMLSVCLVKRVGHVISSKMSSFSSAIDVIEAFNSGNERADAIGNTSLDI